MMSPWMSGWLRPGAESVQTFVVRVWTPAPPAAPETHPELLRGVVEHPATGRHERFRADEELLAFLRRHTERGEWERGKGETP
jgi:hypothetical protein